MSDVKQGKDKKVQAGDQSMKLQHKGPQHYQGDKAADVGDFAMLTGREGALKMEPKVKMRPADKVPGDNLAGKMQGKVHPKDEQAGKKHTEFKKMKKK